MRNGRRPDDTRADGDGFRWLVPKRTILARVALFADTVAYRGQPPWLRLQDFRSRHCFPRFLLQLFYCRTLNSGTINHAAIKSTFSEDGRGFAKEIIMVSPPGRTSAEKRL